MIAFTLSFNYISDTYQALFRQCSDRCQAVFRYCSDSFLLLYTAQPIHAFVRFLPVGISVQAPFPKRDLV